MVDFETFYITWYSRAVYFATEYVSSESDAENIVQDVFLHLYERRELLDTQLNWVAYFFTSIKNKCLDYLSKKLKEHEAICEIQTESTLALRMKLDSLDILDVDFPDEDTLEARLDIALKKLPECCRKIFIMSKLEGKKQKDIAQELQISVNTVESQMAIAYKKLREELKDCIPLFLFLFTLSWNMRTCLNFPFKGMLIKIK